MVIHTWGFVDTRPGSPWTKIELRAERGAILRVSGTTYSAAMACLARVRSALQSWGSLPGKALTHVHQPATGSIGPARSHRSAFPRPMAHRPLRSWHIASHGLLGLDGESRQPQIHDLPLSSSASAPASVTFMCGPLSMDRAGRLPIARVGHLSALRPSGRPRPSRHRFPGRVLDQGQTL